MYSLVESVPAIYLVGTYSQHQSTGLNSKLASLGVFDHRSCQTSCRGSFATGINSSWMQRANVSKNVSTKLKEQKDKYTYFKN
jgi:hypothetical protein